MKGFYLPHLLVILSIPTFAQAAGFAHSDNFVVLAPDQVLADEILRNAEWYRRQIAKEWLGEELPPSIGAAVIHVSLSNFEDSGLSWPVDHPERKLHKIWVVSGRERAAGSTLYHEMVHLVLATQFPDRLPAWADEGIAGLHDDPQRLDVRQQIIGWYRRSGNWPDLAGIFQYPAIVHSDKAAYSVASSVTDYLLTRGDRATFLRFAMAGKKLGWNKALQEHYSISGVAQLQSEWQAWAGQNAQTPN